jgi:hypothetical protein
VAYPRLVGSRNERRAARYIARRFKALGLEVQHEPFQISLFAPEIGSRIVFAVCAGLILIGMLLVQIHPLASAGVWGLAAFLVNSPWRLAKYMGLRWPPFVYSENLVAALPGRTREAPVRVIFMAHYDSKSQVLPTGIRVGLVSTAAILCGLLALMALVDATSFSDICQRRPPWGLTTLAVIALAGLMANYSGNRSPGALDNGSGIGTLLELARSWRPRAGVPAEVVWVATGSEEAGLDGARHFLHLHQAWWAEKPTLLINLESVGAGPGLYLSGEAQGQHLAQAVADELGLPHRQLHVLGAGMDHQPFAAHDLASVSILGDVVRKSFYLHSARDNMDRVDRDALARAGTLAAQLAWCWAELYQLAPESEPAAAPPAPADRVAAPRSSTVR